MSANTHRRDFLKTTAAAGIGYWVAGGVHAQESNSPNEQIAMASVGIGGKGESVWLAWFLVELLRDFAGLADARGEMERAEAWRRRSRELAAAVEAVRGRALRGIRRRYLPSSLRIAVSPEDYRFLDPFREELEGEVWRALEDLKGEDDGGLWLATADPVALVLGVEASLDPGAPPRVDLAYPEGVRTASWAAGAAASGKTGGPWPLRLVLTAAAGDGTALQETVEAWLGLELPRTLVNAERERRGLPPAVDAGSAARHHRNQEEDSAP